MTTETTTPTNPTRELWRNLTLQGWPVLRIWKGSAYLRIPQELRTPITGGCSCTYCKAHPKEVPSWDTLGIPLNQDFRNGTGISQHAHTWTVHAPEWQPSDRVPEKDRGI